MTSSTTITPKKQYTYIVEHLDPELEAWSALEYKAIALESKASGSKFLLSSVPQTFKLPPELQHADGLEVEHKSVEDLFNGSKNEVCLLDPKAERELCPDDGDVFSVFLFGGILGTWIRPIDL
jgi:ribosome biogenesis SPOUT family RNA methylase Rps3